MRKGRQLTGREGFWVVNQACRLVFSRRPNSLKNFFGMTDLPAEVYEISEGWERQKSSEPIADNQMALLAPANGRGGR